MQIASDRPQQQRPVTWAWAASDWIIRTRLQPTSTLQLNAKGTPLASKFIGVISHTHIAATATAPKAR